MNDDRFHGALGFLALAGFLSLMGHIFAQPVIAAMPWLAGHEGAAKTVIVVLPTFTGLALAALAAFSEKPGWSEAGLLCGAIVFAFVLAAGLFFLLDVTQP